MFRIRLRALFAVILVINVGQGTEAQQAEFIGLGTLPGGDYDGEALAVSADGSVVAGYSNYPGSRQAFQWTASMGMLALAPAPSCAEGIAANGNIKVGWIDSYQAVRFSGPGQLVGLGDLPGGLGWSQATAANADGSKIVGWSDGGGGKAAFQWTSANGMLALPILPHNESKANDISADGSAIVGYRRYSTGQANQYEGFLLTDGVRFDLGDLPGGIFFSIANAVSDNGRVVVGRSHASNGSGSEESAFRWTLATGMVRLPPMNAGTQIGEALDSTADGAVVIGWMADGGSGRAFIWDCMHGTRDLRTVLQGDYGVDLSNWSLYAATAITPDGKTIVGRGNRGLGLEPWIVHLPCRPGDANADGFVNGLDIDSFVRVFVDPAGATPHQVCPVDANVDGIIDPGDVTTFIGFLLCP